MHLQIFLCISRCLFPSEKLDLPLDEGFVIAIDLPLQILSAFSMEEDTFVEETEIDIVGILPGHLKEFSELEVEKIDGNEIYVRVDGSRLKGKIGDANSTNLFFTCNEADQDVTLIASADKISSLEHIFYVPKEELTKPFIPTDCLRQPT